METVPHGKTEANMLRDLRNEAPFFWRYALACEDRFPPHRGMRKRNSSSLLGIKCGAIQPGVLFANRFAKGLTAFAFMLRHSLMRL
jgi:hypothetical protein